MAKAFEVYDAPFGRKNVIFTGNFAQLPLVGGKESVSWYSGKIRAYAHSSLRLYDQEPANGKALGVR